MAENYVIVAGVDGSEGGRHALEWAAREALHRGGTVQAVAAWRWDMPDGGLSVADGGPDEEPSQRAARMLEQEIDMLQVDVPVASEVVEGRPADVLSDASRDADLLVLGSHGHSRVWRRVLGSVAEETISKAACPVVVIPVAGGTARRETAPAVPE